MKSCEEIMEILEAFDLTGSLRGAAALVGCDHKTVAHYVALREAGQAVGEKAPRAMLVDEFADKIEELLERSQGRIRADVVHEKLTAMGFTGSERTTRRAVARARRSWWSGNRRVFRPWAPEPGLWLQFAHFRQGRGWYSHFSRGLLRQDAAVAERCALIEAEKDNYKIAWMCRLLDVPRSSFYAWRARVETPTAARRRQLRELIKQAFDDARQVHGCRRIARDLNRAGHECSVGFVADVMRELGLRTVQPRAYKRTTVAGEKPVPAPDLIGRDFDPASSTPSARFVGDITYLKTAWIPAVVATAAL